MRQERPSFRYGPYGEPDARLRKPRIPPKIFLFLVALGVLVYGVRGVGTESAQWKAALLTLAVLLLIVVGQGVGSLFRKRRGSDDSS